MKATKNNRKKQTLIDQTKKYFHKKKQNPFKTKIFQKLAKRKTNRKIIDNRQKIIK